MLRPQHFYEVDGNKVDFYRDFVVPFGKRYAAAVHKLHPGAFIFVEDLQAGKGLNAWYPPLESYQGPWQPAQDSPLH